MKGAPLVEVLQEIALNMVSVGEALLSLTGDDKMAKAVFGNWLAAYFLAAYELTQAEADAVWGVFEPIVDALGLKYQWQREGDQVMAILIRPE
jgi:hypothetical protein